jgi:hypothetical protein
LRLRTWLIGGSIVATLVGCGGKDVSPTAPPTTPPILSPQLLYPPNNFRVVQNDPTTGCAFWPTAGYGFWDTFSWTSVPGAVGYHLYLSHSMAPNPAIDETVLSTSYSKADCGSYVVDAYLTGWNWRVSAVFADGVEGDWSPERALAYTQCRMNGVPCGSR